MLRTITIFVAVWTCVYGECPFFYHHMPHGKFIYEQESDSNLTMAPSKYLLRFECDPGYKLPEPQFIFCRGDKWSDELPQCTMLNCPEPPLVEYAEVKIIKGTMQNPIVGSKVVYTCQKGYEIQGTNESLTCVLEDNTAIWVGSLPSCKEKQSCSDPGLSDHGYRKGSCCFTGEVLTYTCRTNYELIGADSIICGIGGQWSASRPKCRPPIRVCPDPPIIEHGSVRLSAGTMKGDYYKVFDEVEVVCDTGFAFYGRTKYVLCEKNLQWDVEFGECRETHCPRPSLPANGSIAELENNNATEFAENFELTYICNDGYKLFVDNIRQCNKGKWSGKEPICEVIHCYAPPTPENGNKNGADFSVGSMVKFSCFSGYDLLGSVERYCLPNGQWSGELARCNLRSNYCPNPGVPINGKKIGDSYDEGAVVHFTCESGFTLIGPSNRTCMPDQTWSEDEVICLGAHDFDSEHEIGDILHTFAEEKAEEQAMETELFETHLEELRKSPMQLRILDLSYPGRYILYFLFDVSGSVKEKNFNSSIRFAKALVSKIGVSKNGARVGAVTFSSRVTIQFYPLHYQTTEEVLEAFDRIKYERGGTATSSALQIVREEMIPIVRRNLGQDSKLKSVIFLLTDGKANTGGNPKTQGDLLKDAGAEIYCIGVTGDFKKNELYDLASPPINEHVFVLKNYLVMDWLVQEITDGSIDFSECGLAAKRRQRARIIGGEQVFEPWPWMAALYFRSPGINKNRLLELKCGATIIDREWILTAAHCLKKDGKLKETSHVTIKLGLTHVENTTMLQEFEAERFFIHPEYEDTGDDKTYDYDIALMKLTRAIEYNRYVRPVCLPPEELPENSVFYKPKKNAFATGWGHDEAVPIGESSGLRPVSNLKELVLPIQEREICAQSLEDHGLPKQRFTDRMFCAGDGKGEVDTCTGDSGGPLMQQQTNKEGNIYWTQVGIVSWGLGCSQANTYGMYTHVQKLVSWINTVMDDYKNEI